MILKFNVDISLCHKIDPYSDEIQCKRRTLDKHEILHEIFDK